MLALKRAGIRRQRARTVAGLAAGVVPLAIAVHLIAELAATGGAPDPAFLLRHAYLAVPLLAALAAFARATGLGASRREFVRRSALARAAVGTVGATAGIRTLFLTGIAFFVATQAIEGVPIAAGSIVTGLAVAAMGSLVAAVVVFALGRRCTVAGLAGYDATPAAPATPLARGRHAQSSRRAARTFSLCIPNRPPPLPSTT